MTPKTKSLRPVTKLRQQLQRQLFAITSAQNHIDMAVAELYLLCDQLRDLGARTGKPDPRLRKQRSKKS